MDAFLTADGIAALVTLTVLEVVLGIDNVIFISILAGKLPAADQKRARRVGLMGAMVMRILLLMSIAWIVRLTAPLFTVLGQEELEGPGDLLHGLELGGGTDTGHGKTDVDGGSDTLVEQLGFQEDLSTMSSEPHSW